MDPKALSVSPIKTSLIGHYFIHWQDFVILLFLKFPNRWFWNPKYGSNQETWIMDQNIYSHRMPSLILEALALWKDKICRPGCLFILFSLKKLSCMLSSGFNQGRHPQNRCLSLLWGGFLLLFGWFWGGRFGPYYYRHGLFKKGHFAHSYTSVL